MSEIELYQRHRGKQFYKLKKVKNERFYDDFYRGRLSRVRFIT